ncbi:MULTISPECIES: ankyrin repeat domain-containing protein [unclassified Fusibacter]|uniref:ankyrin repeat domain-containing protein n=1 Tax=unclassified Fusibacter TaxID=2624464 RepID=UPI0013E965D0|nr:ankyrin repeat domain-containing protein [Fusibacter sp. A1]MCK8058464.1 hypothetical protein [Fusibacter sp. A2]NPE22768.1 hypothetical protein [Fusibacter sp. A1]
MSIEVDTIDTFLKGLRCESGGYSETMGGENSLRSTLSVVKALGELDRFDGKGSVPHVVDFVKACHKQSGGFSISPLEAESPYDTTNGLILLKNIGETELLAQYLPKALDYISQAAVTQFDFFMAIAAYEECEVAGAVPQAFVLFFEKMLSASLIEGRVADTAIAASALLRAHETIPESDRIISFLLSKQNADGGFGESETSTLFATYCVMRLLVLKQATPDGIRLQKYLDSLKTRFGYSDVTGGKTSAGATYMNLSMRGWLRDLQGYAVSMSRIGDVDGLRRWLEHGGDPDLYDSEGWTVLLAAAARGQAQVVDLLLNHTMKNVPVADPTLRFIQADALPIYMAGQNGDVQTVRLLLNADASHLHEISGVNGHTVLLQAAFYGKEKHLELVRYLLDSADGATQKQMLCSTNVRGYSALDMQDLWHNEAMKALLLSYYPANSDGYLLQKQEYYNRLLLRIASPQALTDELIDTIETCLESADTEVFIRRIDQILAMPHFDIDRLGGPLQMTPLVFTLTGVDANDEKRANRRYRLATKLLEAGADPKVREKHPMAVGAVIRASVLNNFELLKLLRKHMTAEDFAVELNISPAVNGLTAMHDAIHRALTSPLSQLDGHIRQIEWMIGQGARLDIADHTGQTQYQLADSARTDSGFPNVNASAVWQVISATAEI